MLILYCGYRYKSKEDSQRRERWSSPLPRFLLLLVPLYSTFFVLFCVLNIQNARLFSEKSFPIVSQSPHLTGRGTTEVYWRLPRQGAEDAPSRSSPILLASFGLMGAKTLINIVCDHGNAPWKPVHLSRVEGWVLL